MSPNGTLMAYSTPVDIKELRDQAALISMAWKEQEANRKLQNSQHEGTEEALPPLETLTIETQYNNIIVRAIQRSLLLVLVGGVPPTRKKVYKFKITPEAHGDMRYPVSIIPEDAPTSQSKGLEASAENSFPADESTITKRKAPSILSNMSQREKDVKIGALHIQRKKLDALSDFIRKDFEAKGFVMPDDSSFP
jgi:hypothetical protein